MGLRPVWVVRNGLFAITVNGREQYVNFARSFLNSDLAASLARDKYLTRLIMQRHGLPNIPFARARTLDSAKAFLATHGTIIAKPVSGSGARDIHIVTHPAQLDALVISNYILEQYIAGEEMRYLVLNGAVIGVHRSEYGTSVAADRPLQRISYPEHIWDDRLVADSLRIADVLGLRFAAIDFLVDANGQYQVLEVNTVPGLKWFHSPSSGPRVDVARQLLEAVCALGPQASSRSHRLDSVLAEEYA